MMNQSFIFKEGTGKWPGNYLRVEESYIPQQKNSFGNEFASIPLFSGLEEEVSEDWRYKRE